MHLDNYSTIPSNARTPSEVMLPTPHIHEVPEGQLTWEAGHAAAVALTSELQLVDSLRDQGLEPLTAGRLNYEYNVEASRNASTDKMTGLLNREGLQTWFDRYRPRVSAVLLMDGVGFGRFNKQYGQEVGDQVIGYMGRQFAERLRTGVADDVKPEVERRNNPANRDAVAHWPIDASVGRFGGDEFMAIVDLDEVPPDQWDSVMTSVQDRLKNFGTFEVEEGITEPIMVRSVYQISTTPGESVVQLYKSLSENLQTLVASEKSLEKSS